MSSNTLYCPVGWSVCMVESWSPTLFCLLADKDLVAINNTHPVCLSWQFRTMYIPGKLLGGQRPCPGMVGCCCGSSAGSSSDYHGLLVGRHDVVGPPEGGIVQLLHVHCPSWGAVLLPDDHHGDCQTFGFLGGTCSNIPNSMSLASCFFIFAC